MTSRTTPCAPAGALAAFAIRELIEILDQLRNVDNVAMAIGRGVQAEMRTSTDLAKVLDTRHRLCHEAESLFPKVAFALGGVGDAFVSQTRATIEAVHPDGAKLNDVCDQLRKHEEILNPELAAAARQRAGRKAATERKYALSPGAEAAVKLVRECTEADLEFSRVTEVLRRDAVAAAEQGRVSNLIDIASGEAAKELMCDTDTLLKARKEGRIKFAELRGKQWWYSREELRRGEWRFGSKDDKSKKP